MRDFLRGLDLDDETVDTIMAEVGKNFTKIKEENSSLKDKCQEYESQLKEINTKFEESNKSLEELKNVSNENKNLKAQIELNGANVKKEFSKFVTSEIMASVDEGNDFATVLKGYKKDNPQYFGDTVVKKVQSAPSLASSGAIPQTTNEIMNNILRSRNEE